MMQRSKTYLGRLARPNEPTADECPSVVLAGARFFDDGAQQRSPATLRNATVPASRRRTAPSRDPTEPDRDRTKRSAQPTRARRRCTALRFVTAALRPRPIASEGQVQRSGYGVRNGISTAVVAAEAAEGHLWVVGEEQPTVPG